MSATTFFLKYSLALASEAVLLISPLISPLHHWPLLSIPGRRLLPFSVYQSWRSSGFSPGLPTLCPQLTLFTCSQTCVSSSGPTSMSNFRSGGLAASPTQRVQTELAISLPTCSSSKTILVKGQHLQRELCLTPSLHLPCSSLYKLSPVDSISKPYGKSIFLHLHNHHPCSSPLPPDGLPHVHSCFPVSRPCCTLSSGFPLLLF